MDFLRQIAQRQQEHHHQQRLAVTPPAETDIPGVPSPQFALLNYFFPGYAVITSAANAYVGADINAYMPALIAFIAISVVWKYASEKFWHVVDNHFRSSVTIRADDEIYNMVMLWLSRQKFSYNSRHFVANTNVNYRSRSMYVFYFAGDDDDGELDVDINAVTGAFNSHKQALHYTPSFGTHYFWYRMRPLTIMRILNRDQKNNMSQTETEEMRISCFGRDPRILKELLLEARRLHMKRDDHKTIIFRANMLDGYWQRCMSRPNRLLSTVIMDEDVKQELINDAADYLKPITRQWYANRGIPYRRGYLLHGPPGTGKSSLSLALAGYFRMKIYIISLSSSAATEENLTTLFHNLPMRCVVLLEDIDSAGLTHTREDDPKVSATAQKSTARRVTNKGPTPPSTGRVSLSGLLNILDGVASQEGRILVMTTNHMEKLDKALIRPGRVDMTIPFDLADPAMAAAIFRAIYAPYDNEVTTLGEGEDAPSVTAAEARLAAKGGLVLECTSERTSEQARIFGDKIPPQEFSPAEIQGLLLRHKHDPEGALQSTESWVAEMRKERQEKAMKEAEKRRREEEACREQQQEEQGEGKKPLKGQEEKQKKDKDTALVQEDEGPAQGTAKLDASTTKAKKTASDSGYETP
ncbi:hypothetical protein E4U42_005547 [Claviceps africana]|uniref:BCS1 protein n=1 Tax=Claviceps africana TaxID=83212 RepID=A0A8K0J3I6_9HYPO|nr:hypothetical protein E4U42_005547 [Claviceps africana]